MLDQRDQLSSMLQPVCLIITQLLEEGNDFEVSVVGFFPGNVHHCL